MVVVVLISILLDGYICQMNYHVIDFVNVRAIFLSAESSEAPCVKVGPDRFVARDKYVHPQIKFFAPDKKRFVNVARNNVGFVILAILLLRK